MWIFLDNSPNTVVISRSQLASKDQQGFYNINEISVVLYTVLIALAAPIDSIRKETNKSINKKHSEIADTSKVVNMILLASPISSNPIPPHHYHKKKKC